MSGMGADAITIPSHHPDLKEATKGKVTLDVIFKIPQDELLEVRMGFPNVGDFMASLDPPVLAENFFVGLVHAGNGGLYVDPNGARFLIEGAAVSEGSMTVRNAPTVDFVYNRLFLDDVVKRFAGEFIQLDQVYFKLN